MIIHINIYGSFMHLLQSILVEGDEKMPWIDTNICTGCGLCVQECPACAIIITDESAKINANLCIRCGKCHEVCPQNAAKHDSEKIPQQVQENLEWVEKLLKNYETDKKRKEFLKRMKRFFAKEIKVNEKTIEAIGKL